MTIRQLQAYFYTRNLAIQFGTHFLDTPSVTTVLAMTYYTLKAFMSWRGTWHMKSKTLKL